MVSRAQEKHNLLDDPTLLAAAIPTDAGIDGGVRIGTRVAAGTIVVLVQGGCDKSRSLGRFASVSARWLNDSLLVERNRGPVEETRAHLWVRELWLFRLNPFVVGPKGGGECRDRVSQGREFHFLDRDLRGIIIPHGRREECIIVLRVTGFIH